MEYSRKRSLEADEQIQLAAKRRELQIPDQEPLQFPSLLTSKDRFDSRLQEFINFSRRFSKEPFPPIEDADRYTVVLALLVFLLMNADNVEEIELDACAALKYAALWNTNETASENSESKHSSLKQMSRPHEAIFSILCSNDVKALDLVGRGLVACSASARVSEEVAVFINIPVVYNQLIALLEMFDSALPPLKKLLIDKEGGVREAACRLLYSLIKISMGHREDVREESFMVPLVKVLANNEFSRGGIAARIIYKALANATYEQIRLSRDKRVIRDCIGVLYAVLKAGEGDEKSGCNRYARMIHQIGAWRLIKGWIRTMKFNEYVGILKYYVAEDADLTDTDEDDDLSDEDEHVSMSEKMEL